MKMWLIAQRALAKKRQSFQYSNIFVFNRLPSRRKRNSKHYSIIFSFADLVILTPVADSTPNLLIFILTSYLYFIHNYGFRKKLIKFILKRFCTLQFIRGWRFKIAALHPSKQSTYKWILINLLILRFL